jgi:hypothetical protein
MYLIQISICSVHVSYMFRPMRSSLGWQKQENKFTGYLVSLLCASMKHVADLNGIYSYLNFICCCVGLIFLYILHCFFKKSEELPKKYAECLNVHVCMYVCCIYCYRTFLS